MINPNWIKPLKVRDESQRPVGVYKYDNRTYLVRVAGFVYHIWRIAPAQIDFLHPEENNEHGVVRGVAISDGMSIRKLNRTIKEASWWGTPVSDGSP